MLVVTRKKSPRAPSISLGDAVEKVCKIYAFERCHAAPTEGVVQHLGYKSSVNGAALSVVASLKYYGLLERPKDGMLAVSKDVEAFQFAPNETTRQTLVTKWLKTPPLFVELLDKYSEGLPSDKTLKFDLIQRGFSPTAADVCLQAFLRSVDYAHYFEQTPLEKIELSANDDAVIDGGDFELLPAVTSTAQTIPVTHTSQSIASAALHEDVDRIPVRLAGGRRAWIEIPTPFFAADKTRIKQQIDLLLEDDEEDASY